MLQTAGRRRVLRDQEQICLSLGTEKNTWFKKAANIKKPELELYQMAEELLKFSLVGRSRWTWSMLRFHLENTGQCKIQVP